mgnify:CR=1 FL=1
MSNHLALITKTTSLIAAGDIVGAESALAELADTEGDNALMVVLDQLEPKDILAVMREYDDSKASVVNLLVTPEQFARAMVLEKQYKDLTHTHLRNMVTAVVFRDDADPVEFLNAIGSLEGGAEALANYFAEKWSRLEAFARTGTFDAMASVAPAQVPTLQAEISAVLAWAHQNWPDACGPAEDGGAWQCDLRGVQEVSTPLVLEFDEASGQLRTVADSPAPPRTTITRSISCGAYVVDARREAFGLE